MAVAEHYQIQGEFIPGIATGFCSGVARTAGQCGALNGGILSLGMVNGRRNPGEVVDEIYNQVQVLIQRFSDRFGSTNCQELIGCHLGTQEGQKWFKETKQLSNCLNYVETVTALVLDLIENRRKFAE